MALVLKAAPPGPDAIRQAADIVRQGGIAVFPTETVYGVGADIRNVEAVRRLFNLKRRGPCRPLMAHCSDESQLAGYVSELTEAARRLARAFWPGPLALVLSRGELVPDEVVAGGETLGVRMVAHPVAREFIAAVGVPLAATSANLRGEAPTSRFGSISTELLAGADVALDAGVCGQDVPSTVIDLTRDAPYLIRPGAVPIEAVEAVLGRPINR